MLFPRQGILPVSLFSAVPLLPVRGLPPHRTGQLGTDAPPYPSACILFGHSFQGFQEDGPRTGGRRRKHCGELMPLALAGCRRAGVRCCGAGQAAGVQARRCRMAPAERFPAHFRIFRIPQGVLCGRKKAEALVCGSPRKITLWRGLPSARLPSAPRP